MASGISGSVAGNDKKGGGMGRLMGSYVDRGLTWADIDWIWEQSGRLPIVLKGIQCAADARKATQYKGVKGIMISNHGGRSLDTAQPAILALLELHAQCPEVFGRLEVYIDGGIRRGTDILKAICLGATAVGVGRPFLYSVCYGQEGVEHLSQVLKDELETTMRLVGVRDLNEVSPSMLNTSALDHLVMRGTLGAQGQEVHPWIRWSPRAKI